MTYQQAATAKHVASILNHMPAKELNDYGVAGKTQRLISEIHQDPHTLHTDYDDWAARQSHNIGISREAGHIVFLRYGEHYFHKNNNELKFLFSSIADEVEHRKSYDVLSADEVKILDDRIKGSKTCPAIGKIFKVPCSRKHKNFKAKIIQKYRPIFLMKTYRIRLASRKLKQILKIACSWIKKNLTRRS